MFTCKRLANLSQCTMPFRISPAAVCEPPAVPSLALGILRLCVFGYRCAVCFMVALCAFLLTTKDAEGAHVFCSHLCVFGEMPFQIFCLLSGRLQMGSESSVHILDINLSLNM